MPYRGRKTYAADFETSTSAWLDEHGDTRARVWLAGIMDVETEEWRHFINITDFMNYLLELPHNSNIYFHNLKFDGSYIIDWLLSNGYVNNKHERGKERYLKEFSSIITDTRAYYQIEMITEKKQVKKGLRYRTITFYDFAKKIPGSLDSIARSWFPDDEELTKGDLDYDKYRPIGHTPTEEELFYLHKDLLILSKTVKEADKLGLNKMTSAANSYNQWKETLKTGKFRSRYDVLMPKLTKEEDDFIREAYRGGFTYLKEGYEDKLLEPIVGDYATKSWDSNSMYPSKMRYKAMPYGKPIYGKGKYEGNNKLYIQRLKAKFKLKDNHVPTIQLRNNFMFGGANYLKSSLTGDQEFDEMTNGVIELTMTNLDLEIFLNNYHVYEIVYVDNYSFRTLESSNYKTGMFDEFIDKWIRVKENSKGAERENAKLLLNSLYGVFGQRQERSSSRVYMEDDLVKYERLEAEEVKNSKYLPIAVFTTAWARYEMFSLINANYDRFVYCDTDSLHFDVRDTDDDWRPSNLKVGNELGEWGVDTENIRAKYVRPKTYVLQDKAGNIDIKAAGLTKRARNQILENGDPFNDIKIGAVFKGVNLKSDTVPGGVILRPVDFEIKPPEILVIR